MRILMAMMFALLGTVTQAQQDSLFESYEDYAAYVDLNIMEREFVPLILRLGGRDEFTPEELNANNANLRRVWPRNFENARVFRREELGGGLIQEGRVYWTGLHYAYFYAFLHDREDGFVVITFHLNSSIKKVLERF